MVPASDPSQLRRDVPIRKKLIEVALPLEAINAASAREKSIRHGHPSTLHLWWARRPLAAARAVIFAQMVDDPSANPDLFPTEQKQQKERQRLFTIIEDLVKWENTTNEEVLNRARQEIWQSWRRTCAQNADHPRAKELFDRDVLPAFHDPFAGGGALPLEAQRLGLVSYASDLNPVAVLINKAMIEIPPKFAGMPPVNPEARKNPALLATKWKGAQGLAEDVRYYGKWMRDEAEKRIGHLYPKIEVTEEMAKDRKDLKPYVGRKLTVIAWLWARTVKSPNPAFAHIDVPLVSTFFLSSKPGKEAYVLPVVHDGTYWFDVKVGKPKNAEKTKEGTKLSRGSNFNCLMSGTLITSEYIMAEAKAGRLRTKLLAVLVEGDTGRQYLPPTSVMEQLASTEAPGWQPDIEFFKHALGFRVGNYGMSRWSDLFTTRQLVGLSTFASLVSEARKCVQRTVQEGVLPDRPVTPDKPDPRAYADAVATYLALGVGRSANYWSAFAKWGGDFVVQTFGRQAISMVWDFAEVNPFSGSTGNWLGAIDWIDKVVVDALPAIGTGVATAADAQTQRISSNKIVSTDPPYYDNIGYADLSDFFYVWLRQSLQGIHQDLFTTVTVPKAEELVATPARHGGSQNAEEFFLRGMTQAMQSIAKGSHSALPVTIYYAFKQSEGTGESGVFSTGWETFLEAVIRAGFSVTGTWPVRTERSGGFRNSNRSSLASSIVLVCRPRVSKPSRASRRDLIAALTAELPVALNNLQRGGIAPVDLAQAAIGPGMAVFTRYSDVIGAEGKPLTVRDALLLINQTLDEALTQQEGDFDPESRWALAWFEQHGFDDGEYGVAETLSKAKVTSIEGLVKSGILQSKGRRVRLLKPDELPEDWDPETDSRLSAWETVHHLIRALESGGEPAAAALMKKLGARAEVARELAYRLYSIAERKKRAAEALQYNGLVQSWLEIARLAQESPAPAAARDQNLFDNS